jgi:DNA-binding transcriptional ArsR family regulator
VSDAVVTNARRDAQPERRPPVILREVQSIKALTHPARLAVLDELFAGQELTATEAAEIVGITPSAMSYHLRALQKAGIVERAEPSVDGRERPWRASGSRLEVQPDDTPLTSAAGAMLAATVLERLTREFTAWMNSMDREEMPWRDVAGLAGSSLWMTLEEAKDLERVVTELIDRNRGRTMRDHPPGSRRMRLGVLFYPDDPPS